MRARLKSRLLLVISAALGIVGLAEFWLHVNLDPLTDFRVYYDAAARLNAGLPLYPPGARIYPPLFEIALRPLALLPYELAAAIWIAVMIGACVVVLRRLGVRRSATWYGIALLGIGIGWSLAIGQAEVIVTLLLTIGSPWAVAVAGNIKLFPLLVGSYWLARRDWRSLGLLAAWTAGLVVLQFVLEPANTLAFPATLTVVGTQIVENGEHALSPYATSPVLWVVLFVAGFAATIRLGRTRWGWASAVALSVLTSPHLLAYMLMSLMACLRGPTPEPNREASAPVASERRPRRFLGSVEG